MEVLKSKIDGLLVFKPNIFEDKRGFFSEVYQKNAFEEIGIKDHFIQENHSFSRNKYTFRGLHFQKPPFEQSKLVRCIQGEVLDIALDLRKNSITYGKFEKVLLTGENKKQFFIPKGFAHAFLVLSETAVFSYKVDNIYAPDYDCGVIWNDPSLSIDWGMDKVHLIISDKDKKLDFLSDIKSPF